MWGLSHYDCTLGTAFLTLWCGRKKESGREERMKCKKEAVSFVLNI